MWQFAVMWNFLPAGLMHWIINFIIIAGAVGLAASWIGRWIPFFSAYARLLKPIGIVLLVVGVFLKGGEANELGWRAKVAELEAKVAASEQKSKDANKKLDSAIKAKTKTIKEVQVVIQERIKLVEQKIDADCKIDREAIEILNDSAKNQKGKK
jgi:hypothetical protein